MPDLKVLIVCLGTFRVLRIAEQPLSENGLQEIYAAHRWAKPSSETWPSREVKIIGRNPSNTAVVQHHTTLVKDQTIGASHSPELKVAVDIDPPIPENRTVATCERILAADESNLRNLERLKPKNSTANISLWGSYLDNNEPIPDPYYGGMNGFEDVYQQCVALSDAFLDKVAGETM
ncbi:hypothetical protein D9757_005404 [Collybiopsis confluens]|uniref:protein-tyrosine-phosphatase n=1 Tax=Collybiopsis confluens TaxID=2823264 RepID=A0A8H5M9A5_9AGAR|nr:hypothetical protein D9757_005404 [Collybiopsis confluens]